MEPFSPYVEPYPEVSVNISLGDLNTLPPIYTEDLVLENGSIGPKRSLCLRRGWKFWVFIILIILAILQAIVLAFWLTVERSQTNGGLHPPLPPGSN